MGYYLNNKVPLKCNLTVLCVTVKMGVANSPIRNEAQFNTKFSFD